MGGAWVAVLRVCIYTRVMTNFIDINVSVVGRRLKSAALVSEGVYVTAYADRLANFDDAVVDVATEAVGSGSGVRLVFEVSKELGEQVDSVGKARKSLEAGLSKRAEAVAAAGPALAAAGFTQHDAASLLGVPRNAYREFTAGNDGELWGKSVLGQEPVSVDGGVLVLGAWVVDGDQLVVHPDYPVLIEGLGSAVTRRWESLYGPFEVEDEAEDLDIEEEEVDVEAEAEPSEESVSDDAESVSDSQ